MSENCPLCARKFEKLEDYPIIYLRNLERHEIPSDLVFPYRDWDIFVNPESKSINNKAPGEVIDFFRQNRNAKIFDFEGCIWETENLGKEKTYRRLEKDQKLKILKHLNNYLYTLEKFFGKEVSTAHFLPKFNTNSYFRFTYKIPETNYDFCISDEENNEKIRKANFVILGEGINLGSGGGPTLTDLATIAKIEYEGRLLK